MKGEYVLIRDIRNLATSFVLICAIFGSHSQHLKAAHKNYRTKSSTAIAKSAPNGDLRWTKNSSKKLRQFDFSELSEKHHHSLKGRYGRRSEKQNPSSLTKNWYFSWLQSNIKLRALEKLISPRTASFNLACRTRLGRVCIFWWAFNQ